MTFPCFRVDHSPMFEKYFGNLRLAIISRIMKWGPSLYISVINVGAGFTQKGHNVSSSVDACNDERCLSIVPSFVKLINIIPFVQ